MAIWEIGAYYKGKYKNDKTEDFLTKKCAYVGWSEDEAPALHRMLDSVKIGDIIFIKGFYPRLKKHSIKAVGIVTDTKNKLTVLVPE